MGSGGDGGSVTAPAGVDVGSITLHPSGLPHGPQPGLAERSIDTHETHELAMMCETFHPPKLTKFANDLDDGKYAYSESSTWTRRTTPSIQRT